MSAKAPPPPPGEEDDGHAPAAEAEVPETEPEPARSARPPRPDDVDALGPVLSDALERIFGVMRTQGRRRVGQLARRGREKLDLYQARRDVDRLYQKLGREAVRLVEAGELKHPALLNRAERIRQQEAAVREAEVTQRQSAGEPAADDPTSQDLDHDGGSED